MIELARPWALLLLVPLAVLVWHRLKGGEMVLPHAIPSSWREKEGRRVFPPLPWVLRKLAIIGLVLALADPGVRDPAPQGEGIALTFALDLSGSMEARDMGARSRLAVAREELARFIENRPNDLLGLVTFGEEAATRSPPTTDHRHLLQVLHRVRIASDENGTALGAGVGLAAQRIASVPSPSRVVVLLTDGRHNTGALGPLPAVRAARVLGIRVHAVGIGGPAGTEPLDEGLLREIAREGGGRFLRALDAEGFRKVMEELDDLERGPIPLETIGSRASFHRVFLSIGILLLLLEAALWIRPHGRVF